MKILIFSGTTEGRTLSWQLAAAGAEVTVSVATEYGREIQGEIPGILTLRGRMQREEMVRVLRGMTLCVDATHPYAARVTQELQQACKDAGVEYLRLLRPESPLPVENTAVFTSAPEAVAYLARTEGPILLTTGTRELSIWAGIDPARLFPRILPSHAGLAACEALRIPHRNILALQGPFSTELNTALIRQYHIRYLVTKDGGTPGGFPEKAEAARITGTTLIVIRRPPETGFTYNEVLARCQNLIPKKL